MYPLPTFERKGPINQVPADWYNWVSRFFNTLIVTGGRFLFSQDGTRCKLVLGTGDGSSGINRVFVGGVLKTVPEMPTTAASNKWCLKVPFSGADLSWVDWNMADAQPADAEIYDPSATIGDIHVPRAP